MRGEVEVYREFPDGHQELVTKDSNLLVDGAAETIVDMLTTSPSLSAIESVSALLDTSNYTIQAISFGKPADLFSVGGRRVTGHSGGTGTTASIFTNLDGRVRLALDKRGDGT